MLEKEAQTAEYQLSQIWLVIINMWFRGCWPRRHRPHNERGHRDAAAALCRTTGCCCAGIGAKCTEKQHLSTDREVATEIDDARLLVLSIALRKGSPAQQTTNECTLGFNARLLAWLSSI
eukprot:6204952-Pleurochrysis_carterae.AAC.3